MIFWHLRLALLVPALDASTMRCMMQCSSTKAAHDETHNLDGCAPLARVAEAALDDVLGGQVQVSIVADDAHVLAAQLHLRARKSLFRQLANFHALYALPRLHAPHITSARTLRLKPTSQHSV